MTRLLVALALFACLACTSCGPDISIHAVLQESPVNLVLGRQGRPTPSTVPPPPSAVNPVPNFPVPIGPPPPDLGAPLPRPVPTGCADAGLFSYPKLEATAVPAGPPVAATYPFRYHASITYNPGQSGAKTVDLPTSGTRQVANISAVQSDGSWVYDLIETYWDSTTTTTYHVLPQSTTNTAPPASAPYTNGQAGIYIRQIKTVTRNASGGLTGTSSFTPTPEFYLVPFPLTQGVQYQGSGTDGASATTMQSDAQTGAVASRQRVNACGEVVDSWEVSQSGHVVVGPAGSSADRTYQMAIYCASQYGGIAVADQLDESGTGSDGVPYVYHVVAVIDVVPKH